MAAEIKAGVSMRFLILAAVMLAAAPSAASSQIREEVRVASGDAVLAGTLTLPDGPPRAAVVLIQGAGPHDRDQVISGAPMFAQLADALAERGVASIRIDNPGVGASSGQPVAHFKEREFHISRALEALAARPELAVVPLGLIGHSEGALIAPRVWAEHDQAVDFLILIGAPGRPGRTVWVDQQSNPERFPDHDAAGHVAIRSAFDSVAVAAIARDDAALEAATDHLFGVIALSPAETDAVKPDFLARMSSAEMQVFLSHDPAEAVSRVTDPVLAVWGAVDDLTDPALNVPVFLESRNSQSRLTALVLPEEDHFFLRGEGLPPGQHAYGKMNLSPALVDAIDFWLGREEPREEDRRADERRHRGETG